MNWQIVKYRHPRLSVRQPDGEIYQFKVNEDGTIEHDCSLSAQLRDASAIYPDIGVGLATGYLLRMKLDMNGVGACQARNNENERAE